jgi:CubicO group peptidase (beta-lactamase class C family)
VSASDERLQELDRILAEAQAARRLPSVSAAVFRDGKVIWRRAIGLADVARAEPASSEHAYRIGSITKTFTAVCVMQLRDRGVLELDAPLRAYLDEAPAGPTVRHALSHLSGLQREPPGEIWETLEPPSRQELLAQLAEAEQVLPAGRLWHYSNLAFALLGEVVVRTSTTGYQEYLQTNVLDPLGLSRTTFAPSQPAATGYLVDPYSDAVHPEPDLAMSESTAALGQLWSTARDLAAWGAFLAEGRADVLERGTLDEMASVQTMADERGWTLAWGLGLELYRRGDSVLAGHGGAMPGFLAGLAVDRPERTGACVLASASTKAKAEELALDLACAAREALPRPAAAWSPDGGAPAEVLPLLGIWWTEGNQLVLSYRDGRLQAELPDGPAGRSTSWFALEAPDRYRVIEGRERGEQLRVVRDEHGDVLKLYFATYPVTRAPQTFGPETAQSKRSPAAKKSATTPA